MKLKKTTPRTKLTIEQDHKANIPINTFFKHLLICFIRNHKIPNIKIDNLAKIKETHKTKIAFQLKITDTTNA